MSKSYKEQRQYRENEMYDGIKHKTNKQKNKKEKFIHNALRSKNLSELIKYTEED